MIIEVFPYIILLDFCPNAKSAKLNSTPNLVDLQDLKICMGLKNEIGCMHPCKNKSKRVQGFSVRGPEAHT